MQSKKIFIIGAGASGLFCASLLGKQGFDVTIIDNGKKIGRKILMSGGGYCNFTNLDIDVNYYLSQNSHFCKSALKQFTQWDFIHLVNQYKIPYHEKENGQLFCDNSAQDIVKILANECHKANVAFMMQTELNGIEKISNQFHLNTSKGKILCDSVIIATGGLSLPKLGSTPIGYKIAEKFSIPIVPVRAGLVPFTLHQSLLDILSPLAGISIMANISTNNKSFQGNILFTHRGLSGPTILQISNYWKQGDAITINLFPNDDLSDFFDIQRQHFGNQKLKNLISKILPKRFVESLMQLGMIPDLTLKQINTKQQQKLIYQLTSWQITPNGTEGYRTAEVTLGGIDTNFLSSKTMMAKNVDNLYFIGEVVDVTGRLGGYNFQWAWSSAYACARHVEQNL